MNIFSKKIMYKIHTYASLIFCIPLVIACFTGSVLVYKDEINNLLMPGVIYVAKNSDENEQKSRLKFDELREKIEKEYPHHEIVGWNIDADPQKTDKIWLLKHGAGEKEWACVYLDAFSGEIKSDLVPHDSGFIGVITELHENLLLEKSGQILLGLTAIFAFIISISGFIVYRNFWANLLRLRFARMAVFMSDSHKFIGVFSTPVIFAVALSGAWWELRFMFMPPFDNSKFVIGPQIYDKNISIDALVQKAASDMPGFETHYVSFPFYDGANITLYGQKPSQGFLHSQYSSTVSYDKNSANLIDVKDIELASKTDKFLSTFRRAHYGDYNAATKFFWFLCGLAPLALSISGIYLWIKRSNFKRRKR